MKHLQILFLFALISYNSIQAMIEEFKSDTKVESGMSLFWKRTVFSKDDSPSGNEDPFVRLNLVFTKETMSRQGTLSIFIYESNYSNFLGYLLSMEEKTIEYCCTQDLKYRRLCDNKTVGDVIRRPEKHIYDAKVPFSNNLTNTLNANFPVTQTGIYIIQITNCRDSGLGDVVMKGSLIWKNPYGYLPGEVYMLLPIDGILSLCYMLVLIAFGVLCIIYRKVLMKLQYGILGVLAFGIIETASWYFYRLGTNNTGYYSIPALLFVVFLESIQYTIARVLILLVSMGLGIVKWTLGTTKIKIGLLAIFFMLFSFLFKTIREIEALEKKSIVSELVTLLVLIPNVILEMLFYYWIILSLIRTIQQLTLRRQVLKLQMYKAFFAVLVLTGILATIVILYQGYLRLAKTTIPWQNNWIIIVFWEFLFFSIITSVSFLWRPRANNTRYGYAEFFTDDNLEENQNDIPLETINVVGGELTHRKKRSKKEDSITQEKYDNDREKNIEKTKLKINDEFESEIMKFELPSDDDIDLDTQIKKMD